MENIKIIEDYDDHRDENRKREADAIDTAVQSLKPVIDSNLSYLRYAQAKGWFKMTSDEEKERATHNALVTIIGRATGFSIDQARKLAFEILQEVNDHENAHRVADLLGLELKHYEVE